MQPFPLVIDKLPSILFQSLPSTHPFHLTIDKLPSLLVRSLPTLLIWPWTNYPVFASELRQNMRLACMVQYSGQALICLLTNSDGCLLYNVRHRQQRYRSACTNVQADRYLFLSEDIILNRLFFYAVAHLMTDTINL